MNQVELITPSGGWVSPTLPYDECTHRKNPATLSPLLGGLFQAGVVSAELRIAGDPSLLFPEEVESLGRAASQRIQEFAAGRLCARRALVEWGFTDYPLRISQDRRPQWPAPFIGSISHITGMCGAVVANKEQFRAIGLDIEIVGQVTSEMWPTICTSEEAAWLATLREPEQARCAALLFSAKETFYKCQYSVTQQWLEFDDVTLDFFTSVAQAGCFVVRPRSSLALLRHTTTPWKGRFQFHGSFVVTGMVL